MTRQNLILLACLKYIYSNLDDLNQAFESEHDENNVVINGIKTPLITIGEIIELIYELNQSS